MGHRLFQIVHLVLPEMFDCDDVVLERFLLEPVRSQQGPLQRASFDVAEIGWHTYEIVGWVDRFLTWRRDLRVNHHRDRIGEDRFDETRRPLEGGRGRGVVRKVRSLLQHDVQPIPMADAIESLLRPESAERASMLRALAEIRASLGQPGAARRVAEMALQLAEGKT